MAKRVRNGMCVSHLEDGAQKAGRFFPGLCHYQKHRYGEAYPPEDFTICPSCDTEFGYHDSKKTNAELRAKWVKRGLPWSSRVIERPAGWNGLVQLQRAGFFSSEVPV